MIVIFGKGKVGNAMADLLNLLWKDYVVMDDQDRDDAPLEQAESIMVTPWLPQHHKLYQNYKEKCTGELDLIAELREEFSCTDKPFPNLETIGITGTNGKSTTSWIVYNLFKNLFAQQNISTPVFISGNFWTPLSELILELLQQGKTESLVILELSSFMLYNCEQFIFDYGILTNIATDHLDWHKDFYEYTTCKTSLIFQTKKIAYLTKETYKKIPELFKGMLEEENQLQYFDNDFNLSWTQFLWEHNKYNFKSADLLIKQYYIDHHLDFSQEEYQEILKKITPLDHRMKLIKIIKSSDDKNNDNHEIKIYDDGICTSAHALTGALSCIDSSKIVLIAWGYDKWEDYTYLAPLLKEKVAFLSLLGDTGKNKFLPIAEQENIEYSYSETLEQAVNSALEYAQQHAISIVVFSPWSASFDMFKNVYDRCEQFEKIVEKL